MRMRFGHGDETAYQKRRHELREQFARWLIERAMPVDPSDADLLMDWKFVYGDGVLDRWMISDVEGFLFEWCPRKLSAARKDAAEVPHSAAVFVEFLDEVGLLARASSRPVEVRRHCEDSTAEFLEVMADPAKFGLAPDTKEREEPPVGPVHLPAPAEQLAAIRASTAMQQLRSLAEHCAPPGRELTARGDLLRDTRFLAEAIGTEEELEAEVSIAELPGLDRLVHLGIGARVVEPKAGRLVAVPAFAELAEVAAYQRVVTAAVAAGLSQLSRFGGLFEESDLVDRFVELMFAELLDAGPTGVTALRLIQLIERATMMEPDEAYEHSALPDCVDTQLENLEYLGVVAMPGPKRFVTLTPAGIPVAVALVEKAGTVVQVRPSPASASAGEIVDLVGQIESDERHGEASAWFAAQPDPAEAAEALVAEITADDREGLTVALGLHAVEAWSGSTRSPRFGAGRAARTMGWSCGGSSSGPRSTPPPLTRRGSP